MQTLGSSAANFGKAVRPDRLAALTDRLRDRARAIVPAYEIELVRPVHDREEP